MYLYVINVELIKSFVENKNEGQSRDITYKLIQFCPIN